MTKTKKIRVAVLFGGRSAEHEVSLQSAKNVIQHLDESRFEAVPIGIDKQGNWLLGDGLFQQSLEHQQVKSLTHEDQAWFTPAWVNQAVQTQASEQLPTTHPCFDVVFPAVHGTFCEDGTLQGLLALADVPFVGCGVLSSAVGMDKDVAKRLVMQAGISVAPYLAIKQGEWLKQQTHCLQRIKQTLTYPLFVKPANAGSSVGITKVKHEKDLPPAITEAFRFDTKILVENGLNVQELELAVLEAKESGDAPHVSVVGEIKPTHEFYSYEAKYLDDNGASLHIPANVSDTIANAARKMAAAIFEALECEGMARIDLFLDKQSNQLYFNEINTIPGFTKISMYPKLMEATGFSYSSLLSHLVELAMKRHQEKTNLVRTYSQ
jgi:D-alanine-D-alanine ligase